MFSIEKIYNNVVKLPQTIYYETLQRIKEYTNRKLSNYEKWEYRDLMPVDNLQDNKAVQLLTEVIKMRPEIHNIALSGPYGSGKSSIIKTYIKNNPKVKYLNISLAAFKGNKKIKQNSVELGILKQIFYKVKASEIPKSRYRKLNDLGFLYLFIRFCAITAFIVIFYFVFYPEQYKNFIDSLYTSIKGLSLFTSPLSGSVINGIIFIIVSIFLSLFTFIFRTISTIFRIDSIKLSNIGEISSRKDFKDQSIFNKNMDEIMYFFEVTDFEIVFFEDLDRFKDSGIFIALRELNNLLNNDDAIKRKIIFVYAIKDDIFSDTERTKFFDFIIPVIPVVGSTNSKDVLLTFQNENNDFGLDREYINDISPYITDMRMLYNIYNEYKIYLDVLVKKQKIVLSKKQLFSLIVYKNLYPCDFAKLQTGEGLFEAAIEFKEDIRKILIENTKKEIEKIEEELKESDNERVDNIKDAKKIFLYELVCNKEYFETGYIREIRDLPFSDFFKDDFNVIKFFYNNKIYVNGTFGNMSGGREIDFKLSEYSIVLNKLINKMKNIKLRNEEFRSIEQDKIRLLNREILAVSECTIKDLFERAGEIEKIANRNILEEIYKKLDNDVLVFFLERGYIDENYKEYINQFKGVAISEDDNNFIRKVRMHQGLPFNYPLGDVEEIIERFQPYEFNGKGVFNFKILDHMLIIGTLKKGYEKKLNNLILQLANETEASWQFLNAYISNKIKLNENEHINTLIKGLIINAGWSNIWNYIYKKNQLTYEEKLVYLNLIFRNIKIVNLKKYDVNGSLTKVLSEGSEVLQNLTSINDDDKVKIIDDLNIKFQNLDFYDLSTELSNYVIENNCYVINEYMVDSISSFKNKKLFANCERNKFTLINILGDKYFTEYVKENIKDFLENVYFRKEYTRESDKYLGVLVSLNIQDIGLCKSIIDNNSIKIKRLYKFVDSEFMYKHKKEYGEILKHILVNNKFRPNMTNIEYLFKNIDETQEVLMNIVKSKSIKKCLKKSFIQNIKEIPLGIDTLKALLDEKIIPNKYIFKKVWDIISSTEEKMNFLCNYINVLERSEIEYFLNISKEPYSKLSNIQENESMEIPVSDTNLALVEKIEEKGIIGKHDVLKEEKIVVYPSLKS